MVMLAYLRPGTLLPRSLDTVVGADAGAPAYPALTGLLLRRLCLHIGDLSHSLYLLLIRLWWQMLAPPQIVALAPFAVMLTYRRSTTLLAL